jgi:uncharacterized membrane protein YeaQ/YmgE (transglycosylase-associated protein family)
MAMNILLWGIIGGILGGIVSIIIHMNTRQRVLLNISAGVAGALPAGLLLTTMSGIDTVHQRDFSLPVLFISLLGAIVLLAVVELIRHGTAR